MNINSLLTNYYILNKLNTCTANLNKINNRLSAGKRIVSASDSPGEIRRISTLHSEIRCNQFYQRNIQDGLSFLQLKENVVNSMTEITQSLKELSTQFRNDTLNKEDKEKLIQEGNSLLNELCNFHDNTNFNNLNVFSNKNIIIQTNKDNTVNINSDDFFIKNNNNGTYGLYRMEKKIESVEINPSNLNNFDKIYINEHTKIMKKDSIGNVSQISQRDFDNLIKYPVNGTQITLDRNGSQILNLNLKNNKAYLNVERIVRVVKDISTEDILNSSNSIDNDLLNPLVDIKTSIGLKINELDYKYDFNNVKDMNNNITLNKIENIDMAKELMNKLKNQSLLDINMKLFSSNLDNHKNLIIQLLN